MHLLAKHKSAAVIDVMQKRIHFLRLLVFPVRVDVD